MWLKGGQLRLAETLPQKSAWGPKRLSRLLAPGGSWWLLVAPDGGWGWPGSKSSGLRPRWALRVGGQAGGRQAACEDSHRAALGPQVPL